MRYGHGTRERHHQTRRRNSQCHTSDANATIRRELQRICQPALSSAFSMVHARPWSSSNCSRSNSRGSHASHISIQSGSRSSRPKPKQQQQQQQPHHAPVPPTRRQSYPPGAKPLQCDRGWPAGVRGCAAAPSNDGVATGWGGAISIHDFLYLVLVVRRWAGLRARHARTKPSRKAKKTSCEICSRSALYGISVGVGNSSRSNSFGSVQVMDSPSIPQSAAAARSAA